jgi:transcriptional regulator with XRE-family HTH domain
MNVGCRQQVALAFAQALRAQRRRARMSQHLLAMRADLDITYPSLLERGLRQPSLTALIQIAHALRISPGELLQLTLEYLP